MIFTIVSSLSIRFKNILQSKMKSDEHMLLTNNFKLIDLYKRTYINMYTFFDFVVRII